MGGALAWLEWAGQAPTASAPFCLLVLGHSVRAVQGVSHYGLGPYWLISWLVGFLSAFGGGLASALLLQSPAAVPLSVLAHNEVALVYTAAWWLNGYWAPARRAFAALPIRALAGTGLAILRAKSVVSRVEAAAAMFPGVLAAPLLLGTLAGCGGRLLVDAFLRCAGFPVQGLSELAAPGYPLRSAALAAALQYGLVHATRLLTPQQGLGLVVSLYVGHSLAADLTGQPCDYTAPCGRLFHALTRIPAPGTAAAAALAAPVEGANGWHDATPAGAKAKPRAARLSRQRAAAAVGSPLPGAEEESEHEAAGLSTAGRRSARRRVSTVVRS